jgi:hypothetical protein
MPKQVSWLPRLADIRKTVEASPRSPYTRRDIQRLFQLQPRAALNLMDTMPKGKVGGKTTPNLVEREALIDYLEEVRVNEDITALNIKRRAEFEKTPRKAPRSLVRRDLAPVDMTSLPEWIALRRGELHVMFQTTTQLTEGMLLLARILESACDQFAERYEPLRPDPALTPEAIDAITIRRELEELEARHG